MKKNTKYSRIIAFAGRKRAGKDMLANGVVKKCEKGTAVVVTIADNIKFLCCELLNVSYRTLNRMKDDGTTFEKKPDGRWFSVINRETGIPQSVICDEIGDMVFTTVREMLQVIGTDLIRKYVPNWHVDKTVERIKSYDENMIVVVDDVRFINEKCAIEKLGGDVFFVVRPNCWDVSNHVSETSLHYSDFKTDKVIINDLQKETMIDEFNSLYFGEDDSRKCERSDILLSSNPWYSEHVMDIVTNNDDFNFKRGTIIRSVLAQNMNRKQFLEKGIITFESTDQESLYLFRRIMMYDTRSGDGCKSYSLYNPLTNEILKNFIKK